MSAPLTCVAPWGRQRGCPSLPGDSDPHPWLWLGNTCGMPGSTVHTCPTSPVSPVPTARRDTHTELALQPSTGPHLFTDMTDKLQLCAQGLEGARGQQHRTNSHPHRSPWPHSSPFQRSRSHLPASLCPLSMCPAQPPHQGGRSQCPPAPGEDVAGNGGIPAAQHSRPTWLRAQK